MASSISPLWRFVVTTLDGETVTFLDHLASERIVTPKLGEALEISMTMPSDSSEVNLLHTDGFPFVAEGVRQIYGFRRESDTRPYYTCRAAGLILQVGDASGSGDARTRISAWDPWQYLFSRPVLQSSLGTVGRNGPPGVDGRLIDGQNLFYPEDMGAHTMILDILSTTVARAQLDHPAAPSASQECFISTAGTIQICPPPSINGPWEIQQMTSVGQALKDIVDSGVCDIVLTPIYEPWGRAGILCELSIYAQTPPAFGYGDYNYSAVFAWDMPSRSLVTVDNLYDGGQRANRIQYYKGYGGAPAQQVKDVASINRYGEYWAQQSFPGQTVPQAIKAIAAEQLVLRSNFKETLTVSPAPERSPEPFVDYYLGDRVPIYISNRNRQSLPQFATTVVIGHNFANSPTVNVGSTAGFPTSGTFFMSGVHTSYTGTTSSSFTGCGSHPEVFGGETVNVSTVTRAWQRVYGIPIEIDDNGVETVRELLVGPVGGPPVIEGTISTAIMVTTVATQRMTRDTQRIGSVQVANNETVTI